MIRRVLRATVAGLLRGRPRSRDAAGPASRDVLWRAKRNAFRRALLDHGVSESDAREILRPLVGSQAGGCELARLGQLTGLDAQVLDRVVPLMGLQNLITIEERTGGTSRPVLWIIVTEHGSRYAREAAPVPGALPGTSRGVSA